MSALVPSWSSKVVAQSPIVVRGLLLPCTAYTALMQIIVAWHNVHGHLPLWRETCHHRAWRTRPIAFVARGSLLYPAQSPSSQGVCCHLLWQEACCNPLWRMHPPWTSCCTHPWRCTCRLWRTCCTHLWRTSTTCCCMARYGHCCILRTTTWTFDCYMGVVTFFPHICLLLSLLLAIWQ